MFMLLPLAIFTILLFSAMEHQVKISFLPQKISTKVGTIIGRTEIGTKALTSFAQTTMITNPRTTPLTMQATICLLTTSMMKTTRTIWRFFPMTTAGVITSARILLTPTDVTII